MSKGNGKPSGEKVIENITPGPDDVKIKEEVQAAASGTISFTLEEWIVMRDGLAELPYKRSYKIIPKLERFIIAQQSKPIE